MIEAGILFGFVALIVVIGLGAWRTLAGRPPGKRGLAGRIVILTIVATPLVLFSAWEVSKARSFQLFGEIVTRIETDEPVVALTFDDGPTPRFTDEILSILRARQVKATFYVTGGELERYAAEGRKIVAEGHELGNHSYSHERMIIKPLSFIREEIERTDQLIRQAGYTGEIHFRSPYGKRLFLLPLYLSRTNRKNIYYDIEPESYDDVAGSADKIVEHVLSRARPGSIILLHVMYGSRAESMKAVPGIIDGLKAKGYGFKTVSELVKANQFKIE